MFTNTAQTTHLQRSSHVVCANTEHRTGTPNTVTEHRTPNTEHRTPYRHQGLVGIWHLNLHKALCHTWDHTLSRGPLRLSAKRPCAWRTSCGRPRWRCRRRRSTSCLSWRTSSSSPSGRRRCRRRACSTSSSTSGRRRSRRRTWRTSSSCCGHRSRCRHASCDGRGRGRGGRASATGPGGGRGR
eukprot:scaffold17286_cov63-Phaeocystis_antarctica.AAC.1